MKEKTVSGVVIGVNSLSINVSVEERAIVIYLEEMTQLTQSKIEKGMLKKGDNVQITKHKRYFFSDVYSIKKI